MTTSHTTPGTSGTTGTPGTTTHAPDTVALVGHCGFDSGSLRRVAQAAFPQAKVEMVHDEPSLEKLKGPGTLLLINRVLDGRFPESTGVELIARLAKAEDAPRAMLVSNYADAQRAAVDAGALPGFGKNDVGSPALVEKLRTTFAG